MKYPLCVVTVTEIFFMFCNIREVCRIKNFFRFFCGKIEKKRDYDGVGADFEPKSVIFVLKTIKFDKILTKVAKHFVFLNLYVKILVDKGKL